MSYTQLLGLTMPEVLLVLTTAAVLATDQLALRELEPGFRRLIGAMIACAGCVGALAWMIVLPQHGDWMQGTLVVSPLTQLVQGTLLILTVCVLALSVGQEFTPHVGEYFAMLLLATTGLMLLASTEDLLMIFIALELTSLSLYVLTAFNKQNPKSAEAALKYFLFGAMATAFTLFGLSWLYGLTGSTHLRDIAHALAQSGMRQTSSAAGAGGSLDPLLAGAMVLTMAGFGFKIAAVPFHLWAPDAYEGAPAPSAALIASGSKVASFFAFSKVLLVGFAGVAGTGPWCAQAPGWALVLGWVSAASMLWGNLGAIAQPSVRRLLAYSAVAHTGYLLLGFLARGGQGLAAILYHVITYGLTLVGAFGVLSIVEPLAGSNRLEAFAGLHRRSPLLAFCMLIFMLSLAGIPPLAGFFGKFYLFATVLGSGGTNPGTLVLVGLALAMSAVSLYYYLQVLKQIYVAPAPDGASGPMPILSQAVAGVLALLVIVFGCAPNLLLKPLLRSIGSD